MIDAALDSILVVYQSVEADLRDAHDDWYTNIHIRDAMRIDGAIAVQRFVVSSDQLVLDGRRVQPGYWTHTIYEWADTAKAIEAHAIRIGTPLMEVTPTGSFAGLRDSYYRPVFLSHGFSREAGFRHGADLLTAMMIVPEADIAAFTAWFRDRHAPATLALPGIATIGLFAYSDMQSLALSRPFNLVAFYTLSDRVAALKAWSARHDVGSAVDLSAMTGEVEATCWQPRIERLRAAEVASPIGQAAAAEHRARIRFKDKFMTRAEIKREFRQLIEASSRHTSGVSP